MTNMKLNVKITNAILKETISGIKAERQAGNSKIWLRCVLIKCSSTFTFDYFYDNRVYSLKVFCSNAVLYDT